MERLKLSGRMREIPMDEAKRMDFRIGASIEQSSGTRLHLPLFVLEGHIHGLLTERDAEAFAVRMLASLTGVESDLINACAVAL